MKRKVYKITKESDIDKLQDIYSDDCVFIEVETQEEFTLADLRFNADWKSNPEFNIQYLWGETIR